MKKPEIIALVIGLILGGYLTGVTVAMIMSESNIKESCIETTLVTAGNSPIYDCK